MTITRTFAIDRWCGSGLAAVAAVAFVMLGSDPGALAQSSGADRWIATWATAEVGRPQNLVLPPGPPLRPFMASKCPAPAAPTVAPAPGQAFAPPSYVHFTNQTLRQIVHTRLGGSRALVVLSNDYGAVRVTSGAAVVGHPDQHGAHPVAAG